MEFSHFSNWCWYFRSNSIITKPNSPTEYRVQTSVGEFDEEMEMIALGSKWVFIVSPEELPVVFKVVEELTLDDGTIYYRFAGAKELWTETVIRSEFEIVVKSESYKEEQR